MSNKFFRVFLDTEKGGIEIRLKITTQKELKNIYSFLCSYVKLQKRIDINKYITEVLRALIPIVDYYSFIEGLKKENLDITSTKRELYESITAIYPDLSLSNVLAGINSENFENSDDKDGLEDESEFQDLLSQVTSEKKGSKDVSKRKRSSASTREEVDKLEIALKKKIFGQDEAISTLMLNMNLIAAGLEKRSVMLFIGQTGVGKSQLAKELGKRFGAGTIKINCGEYGKSHEYSKLLGSPPGYVGHSETSFLGEKAAISNKWVFILDEIEKADPKLFDILLNVLDEGTLQDSTGKELDFSESIFILTSNNGIFERGAGTTQIGLGSKKIHYEDLIDVLREDLKKTFKPEFLNRIDDIVFFNTLDEESIKKIVRLNLKDYPVKVNSALVNSIVERAYSTEYGARDIKRYIKRNIGRLLANAILDKEVSIDGSRSFKVIPTDEGYELIDTISFEEFSKITAETS